MGLGLRLRLWAVRSAILATAGLLVSLLALTTCLAFTECAAEDVSFCTRTRASGTFDTVTF